MLHYLSMSDPTTGKQDGGSNVGAAVGGAAMAIIVVVLIAIGILLAMWRYKKRYMYISCGGFGDPGQLLM